MEVLLLFLLKKEKRELQGAREPKCYRALFLYRSILPGWLRVDGERAHEPDATSEV